MGIGSVIGSIIGTANPAEAPAAIATAAQKIMSMFVVDKNLRAQIDAATTAENVDLTKAEIAAELAQMQGQMDVNKQEAMAGSLTGKVGAWFIAGWRPFIGWTCGLGLMWAKLGQPFCEFWLAVFHWSQRPGAVPFPSIDIASLIELLVPLLGIAGLRTVEKLKGAEGNR